MAKLLRSGRGLLCRDAWSRYYAGCGELYAAGEKDTRERAEFWRLSIDQPVIVKRGAAIRPGRFRRIGCANGGRIRLLRGLDRSPALLLRFSHPSPGSTTDMALRRCHYRLRHGSGPFRGTASAFGSA